MLQVGRIQNVHLPKDRVTQIHQGFGFVEFVSEEDADYAAKIMNQIRLYGKPIRVNKASADKQKMIEFGANLFIGNLDPMVDERVLFETFQRFGPMASPPKVARDDANLPKGYGFLFYEDFESSDAALQHMDGQFLMNKAITVQYAFKKDGKGERHGDEAERLLAKQAKLHGISSSGGGLPAHLFQAPPTIMPSAPPAMMGGTGRGVHGAPNGPAGYGSMPAYGGPPGRPAVSLPPAPSGLPARPPSGPPVGMPMGNPAHFYAPPPQGFNGPPPPGFVPPGAPAAYGAPPPGYPRYQ